MNDIPDLSKDYDGNAVVYEPSFSKGSADVTVEWYSGDTKLTSAPSNAGSYKVVATATDGKTTITKEKEFVISKVKNTVTINNLNNLNRQYNGNILDDPAITVLGGAVYNYYWLQDDEPILSPKNAGNYMLRIVVQECNNYKEAVEIVNITISKVSADTPVTFDKDGRIMDGMPRSVLFSEWKIGNFSLEELSGITNFWLYKYDNAAKTTRTQIGQITKSSSEPLTYAQYGYQVWVSTTDPNFDGRHYYDLTVYQAESYSGTDWNKGIYHFEFKGHPILSLCKGEDTRVMEVYNSNGERLQPYSVDDHRLHDFYFDEGNVFYCYMDLKTNTSNLNITVNTYLRFGYTDPSYWDDIDYVEDSSNIQPVTTYFIAMKLNNSDEEIALLFDKDEMTVCEMIYMGDGVWRVYDEDPYLPYDYYIDAGQLVIFRIQVNTGVEGADIEFSSNYM